MFSLRPTSSREAEHCDDNMKRRQMQSSRERRDAAPLGTTVYLVFTSEYFLNSKWGLDVVISDHFGPSISRKANDFVID